MKMRREYVSRWIKIPLLILNIAWKSCTVMAEKGERPCLIRNQIAHCGDRSLTSVPQNLPTNITKLFLGLNDLRQVKAFSFKQYTDLILIDLSLNGLTKLENNSFVGPKALITLYLRANSLHLTYDAFPTLCFAGLTSLRTLFLDLNYDSRFINDSQSSRIYPDESLRLLTSLEELAIDMLSTKVLGPGLRALTKLQRIVFTGKILNYMHEAMFANTPHITELIVPSCNIYDSSNYSLAKLTHIKYLDLSYNYNLGFHNATKILFGLQNSSILVLNITSINQPSICGTIPPVDFFRYLHLTPIQEIILDSNDIVMLKPGTLNYFPGSVRYLSVKKTRFTYGPYFHELKNMLGVKKVDLSNSDLGDIKKPPSGIPPQLEELIMNHVTIRGWTYPALEVNKNHVRVLNFSQNSMPGWFLFVNGFEELEILDMSKNDCYDLLNGFFDDFPNLKVLNFSKNLLGEKISSSGSRGLFDKLLKLNILDMSSNRIKHIDGKLFERLTMLKYLYIYDNELQTIQSGSRIALDMMSRRHILEMDLSNNPFLCTCENLDFLRWLLFSTKVKLINTNSYTCRKEFDAQEQIPLNKFLVTAKEQKCKSYSALAFGGVCAILFFLSLSAAGLIYRYRWRIKYLYYVARDRYFYRNQDNEERHFTYNAFISFANEDLEFVDTLMRNLEGQGTLLCCHHRDFRLGEPIGSNIVKAVQNSKHTVVILSENFLASDWCRYEFEMARMESVYSSRNVLLVVKIEDVRTADVPRELLYMMNSESYLEYPDNAEDQATFWLNLHRAVEED